MASYEKPVIDISRRSGHQESFRTAQRYRECNGHLPGPQHSSMRAPPTPRSYSGPVHTPMAGPIPRLDPQQRSSLTRFLSSNFNISGIDDLPSYDNDDLDQKYRNAQLLAANKGASRSASQLRGNQQPPQLSLSDSRHLQDNSRMANRSANEASLRSANLGTYGQVIDLSAEEPDPNIQDNHKTNAQKRLAPYSTAGPGAKRSRTSTKRVTFEDPHKYERKAAPNTAPNRWGNDLAASQPSSRYLSTSTVNANVQGAFPIPSNSRDTKRMPPSHVTPSPPSGRVRQAMTPPAGTQKWISVEDIYQRSPARSHVHSDFDIISLGSQGLTHASPTRLNFKRPSPIRNEALGCRSRMPPPQRTMHDVLTVSDRAKVGQKASNADSRLLDTTRYDQDASSAQDRNRQGLVHNWQTIQKSTKKPEASANRIKDSQSLFEMHLPPHTPLQGHVNNTSFIEQRETRRQITSLEQSCSPMQDKPASERSGSIQHHHSQNSSFLPNAESDSSMSTSARSNRPEKHANSKGNHQKEWASKELSQDQDDGLFIAEILPESREASTSGEVICKIAEKRGEEESSQRGNLGFDVVAPHNKDTGQSTTASTTMSGSGLNESISSKISNEDLTGRSRNRHLQNDSQSKTAPVPVATNNRASFVAPVADMLGDESNPESPGDRGNFQTVADEPTIAYYGDQQAHKLPDKTAAPDEANYQTGGLSPRLKDILDAAESDNVVSDHEYAEQVKRAKERKNGKQTTTMKRKTSAVTVQKKHTPLGSLQKKTREEFQNKAGRIFGSQSSTSDEVRSAQQIKRQETHKGGKPIPPEKVTQDDHDMMALLMDKTKSWREAYDEWLPKCSNQLTYHGFVRRGRRLELNFANGPPLIVKGKSSRARTQISEEELDKLARFRDRNPNAKNKELAEQWNRDTGQRLSVKTMSRRMEVLRSRNKIGRTSLPSAPNDAEQMSEKHMSEQGLSDSDESTETDYSEDEDIEESDQHMVGCHSPGNRPTTGGKTINQKFLETVYGGLDDFSESDSESSLRPWEAPTRLKWSQTRPVPEPLDDRDICHYVYVVQMKLLMMYQDVVDDEDVPWINCSKEFEILDEAKVTASKVFLDLEETPFNQYSYKECERMSHFTGQSDYRKVLVRVSRHLRSHEDKILPRSTRGMMTSRKDYIVKYYISYCHRSVEKDSLANQEQAADNDDSEKILIDSMAARPQAEHHELSRVPGIDQGHGTDFDDLFHDKPETTGNSSRDADLAMDKDTDATGDKKRNEKVSHCLQAKYACTFPGQMSAPQVLSNKHYAILDQANRTAYQHLMTLRRQYLPQLASQRLDIVSEENKEKERLLRNLERQDEMFTLTFSGEAKVPDRSEDNSAMAVQVEVSAWVEEGEWVGPRN